MNTFNRNGSENPTLNVTPVRHANMVGTLVKPAQDIIDSSTPKVVNLLHMAVGISGEVGELINGVLCSDKKNILEELGDTSFYLEGAYQELNSPNIINRPPNKCLSFTDLDRSMKLLVVYSSEFLDMVKKHYVYGKPVTQADEGNMIVVCDKIMGRLLEIGSYYDFSKETFLQHNLSKLAERYEGYKYSDKAAIDRSDKVGQQE